ncbi:MAG: hypothetical protein DI563_20755 [Variovorax paradoxus]|uniref:Uncharacterized protein n=1 Tax=Variovorax paradoxus TaxID=34073 RepID=A0A2W5PTK8_VARPD|nr:MAG: hypothetical protein DI563_20755 [Variovorax paradoxus]
MCKRSAQARQGRRRQGSKPDGRDSARSAGRSPRTLASRGSKELGKLLRWNTPCLSDDVLSLGSYLAPRPDRQGIFGSEARALNPHGDWLSGDQVA